MLLTDPYAIYAQARTYWENARYPHQLRFDVAVNVTHDGKASAAHYHCYYDSDADKVYVTGVSDEELAHPYTPHGIGFKINLFGGDGISLSAPQQTFDYLGVPLLAPNYSFGIAAYQPHGQGIDPQQLVNEVRREYGEGPKSLPTPPPGTLPVIANVEAVKRNYLISLDGVTQLLGHDDYQLTLQPLNDPSKYRLRELFIDTRTFATDRAVTAGNFRVDGLTRVPWTIDFQQIGGAPFIVRETTSLSFSLLRRHYDTASVTIGGITPQKIPYAAKYNGVAVNERTGIPPLTEP